MLSAMVMRIAATIYAAAGLLALPACGEAPAPVPGPAAALPAAPVLLAPDIASFYAARGHRPLWVAGGKLRPEAAILARTLADAGRHGLDPERYAVGELRQAMDAARSGDRRALARADLLLSRGYADYLRDLRMPAVDPAMAYVEPGLEPLAPAAGALLEAAAAAPSLGEHLAEAQRMNPLYDSMVRGLAAWRARWGRLPAVEVPAGPAIGPGVSGPRVALLRRRLGVPAGDRYDSALAEALAAFKRVHGLAGGPVDDAATLAALNEGPAAYEKRILANLERARAIPAWKGRSVLVDASGARLWMVEDGKAVGTMRVVAGKAGMATPAIAGRIRYATLNPYWNLPPDLARERARKVLRRGLGVVKRERLQALSDWGEKARVVPLSAVDWRAVAAGRRTLRLRQLPGGGNMMGAVKFMFPNELGIYLHDTPDKSLFTRTDRHLSSGCVRLEDAPRLAAWLFGGAPPGPAGKRPEQDVDLPEPVPVYITYLTAGPGPGGIAFRADPYRRDRQLLARLAGKSRRA
jgi:murein L,D-transpeptidase YcbB/YkuD